MRNKELGLIEPMLPDDENIPMDGGLNGDTNNNGSLI
jgi:hypothetical protein